MLTDPSLIRVVMLDAVGTLIHPCPSAAQVYETHGRRFGSRVDAATIATRLRKALQQLSTDSPHVSSEAREYQRWQTIVEEVFDDVPDAGDELFRSLWEYFAHADHWSVYDDVAPAWSALESRGLPIGIASNFDARLASICHQLSPLHRHQHLFYSSGVGAAKPHAHFFCTIQQALDVPAQSILLIGDDVCNDFLGAAAAGWQSLLLDRDGNSDLPALRSLCQLSQLLA